MQKLSERKIILLILCLGLGLRLVSLNQSLWMDEAISATVAKNFSLTQIASSFSYSDTHPPLFYLILRVWTLVFGFSEISLRLPSVIFGVLTIYIVYKIGFTFNKRMGCIGSLLLAVSPLHIYYSQEARMYSLTTFLVTLVAYFLLKKKWIGFSLSVLLLGVSDYLPLVVLAPFGIYVFFYLKESGTKDKFLLALIPLLVFLLFWFPVLKMQSISTSGFLEKFPAWRSVLGTASLKELALVWAKFVIGRISFENRVIYALLVLVPTGVYIWLLTKVIGFSKKGVFLWLWFLLPIAITLLASIWIPGFSYFRLIFTLPAFTLLLAWALSKVVLQRALIAIAVFFNLTFSSVYLFNADFWRENWKEAVPFLEDRIKGNELVVVSYFEPFTPYLWYAREKDKVSTFGKTYFEEKHALYTLDYLMDLTDPDRKNYEKLVNLGFRQENVYNFRGVGQVRYWVK